jgi:hypothetical protein
MRFAGRILLLIALVALGVRQGGNPNSDTLALQLTTEVVMTVGGPVIVPVVAQAKIARECPLPIISHAGATEKELIAAVVNRAAECAVLEAATNSARGGRDVR